jgi:hypothetical protein
MQGGGSKQLFAIVGVMLGLFGAGGLGSLFASKAANEAAEKAAPQAAEEAAQKAAPQAAEEAADQIGKQLQSESAGP